VEEGNKELAHDLELETETEELGCVDWEAVPEVEEGTNPLYKYKSIGDRRSAMESSRRS
jgi:hypothetical protein